MSAYTLFVLIKECDNHVFLFVKVGIVHHIVLCHILNVLLNLVDNIGIVLCPALLTDEVKDKLLSFRVNEEIFGINEVSVVS